MLVPFGEFGDPLRRCPETVIGRVGVGQRYNAGRDQLRTGLKDTKAVGMVLISLQLLNIQHKLLKFPTYINPEESALRLKQKRRRKWYMLPLQADLEVSQPSIPT
jgi:hypothetical protein